jgi:hypothetical protein
MGAGVGMPVYFNGALGYWYDPVGVRLSGMYFGKRSNGVQFNLGYELSENDNTSHCLGIAIGKSEDQGCDWSYLGPVYNYYYYWLFLEIGLSKVIEVRRGDFSDTPYFPLFQISYIHRF